MARRIALSAPYGHLRPCMGTHALIYNHVRLSRTPRSIVVTDCVTTSVKPVCSAFCTGWTAAPAGTLNRPTSHADQLHAAAALLVARRIDASSRSTPSTRTL